jgi:hypothetical protein
MTKRVFLAGLLGGIAMWTAIVHMVLPVPSPTSQQKQAAMRRLGFVVTLGNAGGHRNQRLLLELVRLSG